MQPYLAASDYIDCHHPAIQERATALAQNRPDQIEVAKACFEWVRDTIRHTSDYKDQTITCRASDVLLQGTGFCYAKSHLLAALLRANAIPAGLCYQRLSVNEIGSPLCLHGLNAVYLPAFGWYRIDPRGNKPGIKAEFCPPVEKLAFALQFPEETDLPEIWPEPLPVVVDVLLTYKGYKQVSANLPDIDLLTLVR